MKTMSAGTTPGDVLRFAIPMTLILGVGTGGQCTEYYLRVREAKQIVGPVRHAARNSIDVVSAAADLGRIKSILRLSTTDLAQTLGVSRQAIYNWKAGTHIKADNLKRLDNLNRAATTIARAGITVSPALLDRKLSGGRTLLELVGEGTDGEAAAGSLISLVQEEAHQRNEIDRLLAGRELASEDTSGYGVPSFNEG